jgi:hypothetical protein
MADWTTITKEQFDAAYNKHLPSGWIKFAYKYFSTSTEQKNMSLKNGLAYFLGGLFLVGFLGTIFNANKNFLKFFIGAYAIMLSALVLYLFSAVLLNNYRIGLIKKELGINSDEYDALLAKYY